MQKVVHASLHGNAITIEEAGYQALGAYLARAAAQLAADPDRDEILGDLEQAIADKCARFLGPHKSVVSEAEMRQVLDEMGPVGAPEGVGPDAVAPGAPGAAPAPEAAPSPGAPPAGAPVRRLYRVLEGGKLAGLCNGLGAYFGIDANIVRVIFVVLALVTQGAWLLVYLVLVFVVPAAGTPEERAAARGLPFSAQQLVDEAKRHYANLEQELRGPWASWKGQWSSSGWRASHQDRREARRAARDARRAWRTQQAGWTASPGAATGVPPAQPSAHYAQQLMTGLMVPVVAFWSAAFVAAWLVAAAMLVADGRILGWSPEVPLWASLLIATLALMVITRPLGFARTALHRAPSPGAIPWLAAWDGIFRLGFMLCFGWLAWHLFPAVREVALDLPGAWETIRDSWRASH